VSRVDNEASFSDRLDDPVLTPGVLDAVSCLIVVAELPTLAVVRVNAAVRALTGYSEDELLGRRWEELLEPADRETLRTAIAGSDGPALGVETTLTTQRGDRRRVLWSLALVGDDTEGPSHVVLSGIDVTPELHTSGLFSQLVRTAAAPALVGTDLRGRVTLFNSAAERMLGYAASTMLGQVLSQDLFEPAEFEERALRLGVPADLRLLAADLSQLDRRRSNPDLGSFDRRRGADGEAGGTERRGERRVERRTDRRGAGDRRSDRRNGAPQARDWTLVRQGGGRFTASLVVVQVTDAGGEAVGYLGVADDVTEQRRSRNLLVAGLEKEVEAVRRLQELDRAKDDFVATVSHELRTPITSILGYVELLLEIVLDDDVDPTHIEMLEAVKRNGDRLRALADNLLTLSSFESGEFVLHATEVDLGDVVRRASEALRPLIADRRLDTSYELPPRPVLVRGDGAHLERVLFNLLSNALKFTEDGGSIACVLREDEEMAVLEVSDTGIGIPAAEQDQLFTRFFRSSTAQRRAIQGTGMGLAIVASIVRRHGGDVRVVSDESKGTTVSIHLPLMNAEERDL
jgi:PAS domain S-box-containing protein